MKKAFLAFITLLCSTVYIASGQQSTSTGTYTRADTLLGTVTALRSCYDVKSYDIKLRFNLPDKSISGSNTIGFKAVTSFNKMQLDLAANMRIKAITYKGRPLRYTRKYSAIFINMGEKVDKGTLAYIKVIYAGRPQEAKNAPWDGGFIYKKDAMGKPWAAVACQGLGAHIWLPVKDSQSDEADQVTMCYEVPMGVMAIGNGTLLFTETMKDGYKADVWRVVNPINTYNITFYIGNYLPQSSVYNGLKGKLDVTYWALDDGNAEKYFAHYAQDVPHMLKSFEDWFGPYPFYSDGYKMVQAPYAGMEHQSAIANGNGLRNGYLGRDLSGTGEGMFWDFMTVHESGHEWFGNNITTKDIADMWVHESFTNFSEGLFVESTRGKAAGYAYIIGLRKNIRNDKPIIGPYGVNKEGSGDMYYKGANMLLSLRAWLNNDVLFRQLLQGLNKRFYQQTVTGQQVQEYMQQATHLPLAPFFSQYLQTTRVPVFSYSIHRGTITYRWQNVVNGFAMPMDVYLSNNRRLRLYPTIKTKSSRLPGVATDSIRPAPEFYVTSVPYITPSH